MWSKVIANYKMTVKESWVRDFYTMFIVRPIAALIVIPISNTKVTPNQITILSIILHFFTLYALLRTKFFIAGLGLFFVYLLDCVDGQLAREKKMVSKFGVHFDPAVDFMKETTFYSVLLILNIHNQTLFVLQILAFLILLHSFFIDWLKKRNNVLYEKESTVYNKYKSKFGIQFWNIGARQLIYTISIFFKRPEIIIFYVLTIGTILTGQKFYRFFSRLK